MNKEKKKKYLDSIDNFMEFNDEIKSQIFLLGTIRQFNKDGLIYASGSSCTSIDIVIEGSLSAYSLSESGSENVIFTLQKNSIIGGNLLFSPSPYYPISIFCKKDCTLLNISKQSIETLLAHKDFALFFIKNISKNAQSLNKKVISYTQNTLRENILEYIQELVVIQRHNQVELPITKNELSQLLGVQRQSLFREFKKMSDDGLIKVDNRKITIL